MEPNVKSHISQRPAAISAHQWNPRQVPLAKDLALSEVPKESDEVGWNAGSCASWEAAMVHGCTLTTNHLDG